MADPVGERGLERPAVLGLFVGDHLPGRHVDRVGAVRREGPGDRHALVPGVAALGPVGGGDTDGHGPLLRPHGPYGVEDLQREAQSAFQRAAVGVGAPVGER